MITPIGRQCLLEVCVASPEGALAAASGGADRIELNCALELGGLTPSIGLMREVKRLVDTPVIAMVRPRAGGFGYREGEFTVMQLDAESLLATGADGIAFGILTSDGRVDERRCREMLRIAGDRDAVFHRAFDFTQDAEEALKTLIDLGMQRVMTSGQRATALEGAERVARLLEVAAGRIEILPAGAIRSSNVAELLDRCSCEQVHGSFAKLTRHTTDQSHGILLGRVDAETEGRLCVTDSDEVARVRKILDGRMRPD